jgi:hypothetical protein
MGDSSPTPVPPCSSLGHETTMVGAAGSSRAHSWSRVSVSSPLLRKSMGGRRTPVPAGNSGILADHLSGRRRQWWPVQFRQGYWASTGRRSPTSILHSTSEYADGCPPRRHHRAGTPFTVALSGTSRTTHADAPTTALGATFIACRITEAAPISTSQPIVQSPEIVAAGFTETKSLRTESWPIVAPGLR